MGLSRGSSSVSGSYGGLEKCECGWPAKIFTSRTEKNPGRRFYGCPLYKVGGYQHCKFFKWYDQKEVKKGKFFKWYDQEEVKGGWPQEEVKGGWPQRNASMLFDLFDFV